MAWIRTVTHEIISQKILHEFRGGHRGMILRRARLGTLPPGTWQIKASIDDGTNYTVLVSIKS